ncbi:MAG TPA: UbiA prenyltransferase family protein [Fimbriimonas sp.]|nr:UbiA prenyltransferase family protein [Fimbriimonas sp.]
MTFLKMLRVKQWTKNVFVFAAYLFTTGWAVTGATKNTLLAFGSMCLLSSATYIINDIIDRDKDRNHPTKKNRPFASGALSPATGYVMAAMLALGGFTLGFVADMKVVYALLVYVGIQVVYNAGLRSQPVVDVFCIAAGFVVRVIVGALAIQVQVSVWILLCTATLALLLGFGKRRHEFLLQGANANETRKSLSGYTAQSLDVLVAFSATCAALTYSIYSVESVTARNHTGLILTTPIVLFGIARYLVVVFGSGQTGEPETLVIKDKFILFSFFAYIAAAVIALKDISFPFLSR